MNNNIKKIKKDDFVNYKSMSDLITNKSTSIAGFTVSMPSLEDDRYNTDVYTLDLKSKALIRLTKDENATMVCWLDDCPVFKIKNDKEIVLYKLIDGKREVVARLPKTSTMIKYDGKERIYFVDIFDSSETNDNDCYRVIDEIPFWLDGFGFSNKKRKMLHVYSLMDHKIESITDMYTEVISYTMSDIKVTIIATTFKSKKDITKEILVYDSKSKKIVTALKHGSHIVEVAGYIADQLVFMGSDMKKYGVKENPSFYILNDGISTMTHFYDNSAAPSIGSDCKQGTGITTIFSEDKLYFLSAIGVESTVVEVGVKSGIDISMSNLGTMSCFNLISSDLLFVSSMKNELQEIYMKKNGNIHRLTDFNTHIYKERYIAPMSELWFEHKGIDMHGMVLEPYGYEKGKDYPGILMIHGGPKGIYGKHFSHQMQYMASQGYFVFFTNPVGSCGRGNKFSDITGELGKLDYDIFMKFTDVILDKFPICKKNLFVTGGSYGGFMVNWIVGHTDRFAGAVSQRSISNWFSKITSTDIGYYYNTDQMPGDPWTNSEIMWDRSPLKYADKVNTPTLLIHGEDDHRCGVIEAQQMFLALKYHNVDTRLVILKNSSHNVMSLGKPKTRLVWLEEMNNWFDKYKTL